MKIHDLSIPLSESLEVWPGDPRVRLTRIADMDAGDDANVTKLETGVHAGTHVDAPIHFVRGGRAVDELDLHVLVGEACVVDAGRADLLTADVLNDLAIPRGTERVLFRTKNTQLRIEADRRFRTDFVAISADGAQWIVDRGVRLVGVDYLSVAPFDSPGPTHVTLLEAGVVVVEGLNLHGIEPGRYELVCLPLRITGCDGAPARVILIDRGTQHDRLTLSPKS